MDGVEAAAGMEGAAGASSVDGTASRAAGTVSAAGAEAMVLGWLGVEVVVEVAGLLLGSEGWFTVGAASWAQEITADSSMQRRRE